jgi:metal-responsive CopG/Arc/MetJ family transcriptional regulator
MTSKAKRVITSVKIPQTLYEDFKVTSIKTKMNLQDIVERAMYMYLTDSQFRQTIHEQYNTYYTGSSIIDAIK